MLHLFDFLGKLVFAPDLQMEHVELACGGRYFRVLIVLVCDHVVCDFLDLRLVLGQSLVEIALWLGEAVDGFDDSNAVVFVEIELV